MVFPLPDLIAAWPLPFHLRACPSLSLSLFKHFLLRAFYSSGIALFRALHLPITQSVPSPVHLQSDSIPDGRESFSQGRLTSGQIRLRQGELEDMYDVAPQLDLLHNSLCCTIHR